MAELTFKGKDFVYNHHLAVPFRPLKPQLDKSVGDGGLSGNLIIHGDNLHALKALLPLYANKVDCVIIDPPYNTGNENWVYNDNVRAPAIKDWLAKEVGVDDALRHDKWCAMMWPRLRLMRELLTDRGSIWMTLDDNEYHHARQMLDEIFGEENFVATIAWKARDSVQNDTDISTNNLNYLFGYAKNRRRENRRLKDRNAATWFDEPSFVFLPQDIDASRYSNPDNDPRGDWKDDPFDAPNVRENLTYEIVNPNTKRSYLPPAGRCWRTTEEEYRKLESDGRIIFGKTGLAGPKLKVFAGEKEDFGEVPTVWWDGPATTTDAVKWLNKLNLPIGFDTPKPHQLIRKLLQHVSREDSIILDSFAGSGSTAHAVLKQNAEDGGNRKFILVEMEDYAESLTAGRVRRVISGYEMQGTHKEILLRKKLTWTTLKDAENLLARVVELEERSGSRFEKIRKVVDGAELVVTGETSFVQKVEGLGGAFTFCELGQPIGLERLLTGVDLPNLEGLASILFHMATGQAYDESQMGVITIDVPGLRFIGSYSGRSFWMLYEPDVEFLKSNEAALTLEMARKIQVRGEGDHVVYAPARFVSDRILRDNGVSVEFAPLPWALYRVETIGAS